MIPSLLAHVIDIFPCSWREDFTEIQSVKKLPGWILKKTFYLYLLFIDRVCWLQLLCCWELDSVPVSQCVLVLGKKCFQLFEIFYFFIVYRNSFRCLEQRRFFMKCFPFADGNIFRFQMEPLSGDINGKIPPMKPSEC